MDLQKRNSVLCSFLLYFLRPQGNMYLTDVSLAQEEHTDTGLSDTSTNGIRQFFLVYGFLERQFQALPAAADRSYLVPLEGDDARPEDAGTILENVCS